MDQTTNKTLRHFLLRVLLVIFVLVLGLFNETTPSRASYEVGGPIISDTNWTLINSPYIVIANVEIRENVTLIIEPGVVVKFNDGYSLEVSGTLVVQGTPTSRITFTSNQANATPGDWGNIRFTSTAVTTTMDLDGNYISGSILQNCIIEYGGAGVTSAIDAHSLLIDGCIIQFNTARGLSDIGTELAPGRIINNTIRYNSNFPDNFRENGGGIFAINSKVFGNTIERNSAFNGGGIYVEDSNVNGNTINNNSAFIGAGICTETSFVISNRVQNNIAPYQIDNVMIDSTYGGGIYAEDSIIISNTVAGNRSATSGGGIRILRGSVSDNTIVDNTSGKGGGIYASGSNLIDNIVGHNFAYQYGGGIYADKNVVVGGSEIYANIVTDNSAYDNGGGIFAYESSVISSTVVNNTVLNESAQGSGVFFDSSNEFLYNSVIGNSGPSGTMIGGVDISGTPQVHYNNFYSNQPYDITVLSSSDISGTLNYWGTVNSVDILKQVYDWYDDTSRGRFLYIPYLQEPDPSSPVPPPLNLSVDFQDDRAELIWEQLPSFTTGWGYKVYYDTDSQLPPFDGTGLNEGNSPIDVGDLNSFVLTKLDTNKDYYITVTAYDNLGRESWYSNVIMRRSGYWIYLPSVHR